MIADIKALSPEKKQHLVAVGMGTLLCLAAVYFLLITSAKENLVKLKAQAAEAEKKFTDADRLQKRAQLVQEELDKLEERLGKIEAGMVDSDPVQWIRSTEIKFRAQAPYKVEIPNFPFRGHADMGMIPDFPYKSAVYLFSGTAYYHDLGRYLADWENQFPYVRVMNLEITPEESSNFNSSAEDRERLSFTFEVAVLVKPTKRN
jgi:hypothetical protein